MEPGELQSGLYETIDQNQVILNTTFDADLELWQHAKEQICSILCASLLFHAVLCSIWFYVGFCSSKTGFSPHMGADSSSFW